MGAEAKRYLQEHSIPQLFESLMTGLIYNRPNDPIQFLESSIAKVRQNPELVLKWDSFVEPKARAAAEKAFKAGGGSGMLRKTAGGGGEADQAKARINTTASSNAAKGSSSRDSSHPSRKNPSQHQQNGGRSRQNSHSAEKISGSPSSSMRPNSLTQKAQNAQISPDAPIILFMGGPGGGKTRYAAQLQEQLRAEGLVHICMPDLVRTAIARYKDRMQEWRIAAERYQRGELIPNELAQQLVKAEMGKHPNARAYFLEGFPREARQVEDFEQNVRPVNMAMILDYDEEVLRKHMQSRGLLSEVIDRRITEFKQKTLPSAKYFDDQRLLHLIPGEKEDNVIIERMKKLALRAMRARIKGKSNGGGGGTSTSASSSARGEGKDGGMASGDTEMMNGRMKDSELVTDQNAPLEEEKEERRVESPPIMPNQRQGTAGSQTEANKIISKPNSAGTVKSIASSSATKEIRTAEEPMRNNSGQQKKSRGGIGSAGNKEKGVQNGAGSREGSAKSQQGQGMMSSTISTLKPSEGPFRELLADSGQIASTKSPAANSAISTDSDTYPKGLPSEAPVILIIGAPGSNKSKFAQRVARKYDGFVYLGMGELFRRKVLQSGEDELWARIGKKIDAGETIPTRICRDLLYTALHERGQNGWGYVVEGYPRTLPQAEDIEAQLGRLDLAILIDCTEQFCRDALRRRKDKEEGTERADDDEGVVRVRLSLFKQNTLPMLKHLDDRGLLRVVQFDESAVVADMHKKEKIEGDSNEEKVFQEICSIIDNTLFIQDDGNGKSLGSSKQNSVDEIGDSSHQQQA